MPNVQKIWGINLTGTPWATSACCGMTVYLAATVKTFSPYHQNICKSRIFEVVSEVELTEILQETKSTHSSEYSSGSPDEPGIQRNLVMQMLLQPGRQNLRN